ncbi:MAG: group I intron-associated PD-(D/E)XK endonuclease [Betaproteobacteria bacterium]
MNTKQKGIVAEFKVISRLLELGYTVFTPVGNYGPVDAIALKDNKYVRGQIKLACPKPPSIEFSTIDCGRSRQGYQEVADVFWVYSPSCDEVYEIPTGIVSIKSMRLRVDETTSPGRRMDVTMAKDYILR